MGFGWFGDAAVIGYLPFPYSFSEFSQGRFWVDSFSPIPGGWLVRGRDNAKPGNLEIEIRPIDDVAVLSDIAAFIDGLNDAEREFINKRLKYLSSPALF